MLDTLQILNIRLLLNLENYGILLSKYGSEWITLGKFQSFYERNVHS